MLKAVPWPDSQGYRANNDWHQARLNLLAEIWTWIERDDTRNPNKVLDFKRADGKLPRRDRREP